ncbi:M3 family metallopeptidase [bacterium]|nr:M3 family metallopeptidase [bacterium]
MNKILAARSGPHQTLNFSAFDDGDFKPSILEALDNGKRQIEQIKSLPATFENTMVGLEKAFEGLDFTYTVLSNLSHADTNEARQALSMEMAPILSSFSSDVLLDQDLFSKIKELFDKKESLNLNKEQLQLLDKVYRDFSRNGALLSPSDKEKLRAIDQELSGLNPKFAENVLKSTQKFELLVTDESELEGLGEDFRESLKEAAEAKGQKGWLFTLSMPIYVHTTAFSKNRKLRESLYKAYTSRSFRDDFNNEDVILKIVNLSNEKAKILGFKDFASFRLAERMAETPEKVWSFLNRLLEASKPKALEELAEVKALAKKMDGLEDFKPWDFAYYAERLKEQRYDLKEEDTKPYFELNKALHGAFEHAKRLYSLEFKESDQYSKYHPEVRTFEVYKADTKDFIGVFYTDFFPRPGKANGAWMTSYLEQGLFDGEVRRPHVSIVCNFTKPTKTKPSLLTFNEVSTLFHEFGHALHGLLSQQTYKSLSGTNVYLDFVELPSQVMENWLTEKEALSLFAKHYETGELIPDSLIEKIKKAEKHLVGYSSVRQLNFAILDMSWFTTDPKTIKDVSEFEKVATERTKMFEPVEGSNLSCSFSHIFTGMYSAGYYSYKWAEALDADVFEFFQEKGIFDKELAAMFEIHILSKGGSDHPMNLFKNFRGREPDPDALLRRDGLLG